jgi:hypothetical protein
MFGRMLSASRKFVQVVIRQLGVIDVAECATKKMGKVVSHPTYLPRCSNFSPLSRPLHPLVLLGMSLSSRNSDLVVEKR